MAKKQSLYASKDKVKHIKKEIKEGVPFDIPVSPSDMPKWFQKATKGILSKNKPKSPPKDPYIPRDKDLYTPAPLTPSKRWSELVESKGKAAGFRGAKSPKKIAKKPYKRNK